MNGDIYEGDFVFNQKEGIGKLVYKDKGTYYGYWQGGQRSNEGVFTYPNQDLYSGNWVNGKKEGTGTFIFFETGMKMYGQWKEGNFMSGKWIYPNGSHFEGKFDNNRPKGKGLWKFANGNQAEGEYTQITRVNPDPKLADELKLIWKTTTAS